MTADGHSRVLGFLKLEPHSCLSTCCGERPLWSEQINELTVGCASSRASGLGVGDFFARTALQDTQETVNFLIWLLQTSR
jgi:hypothetical protein